MTKTTTERTTKWYHNNKEKARIYAKRTRERRRKWFDGVLEKLECIKCGQNHPATLDFHHRDPKTKINNVSTMLGTKKSKKAILEEIEKCDVLCANCHRILHHDEREAEKTKGQDA